MKFLTIITFVISFITAAEANQKSKAYFAGGCFWCMEESFEKLSGVEKVISGYSGGTTENPTYKEVVYGKTGHFEVVEIIYDKEIISFDELLNIFWKNIDPFDPYGPIRIEGIYIFPKNVKQLIKRNNFFVIDNFNHLKMTSFTINYFFVSWIFSSTPRVTRYYFFNST